MLENLPTDIYKILEGKTLGDPELISRFGSEVGGLLKKRLEAKESGPPTLRMSNVGRPLRQLYYELRGYVPEKISGPTLLKFLYGDLTESLVLALAEAAGYTLERTQEEIVVDGVKGHIDGVLNGVLIDVKSCSSYSFMKFKNGDLLNEGSDPFGYSGQACGYAKALGLPFAWIAFDKVSGEITVLELPQEKIDEYDISKRISTAKEVIKDETPPERCYQPVPVSKTDKTGNEILSIGCSYCGYKTECWKDVNNGQGLQVRYYSTGPKFFTSLVKEPRLNNQYTHESPFTTKEGTEAS